MADATAYPWNAHIEEADAPPGPEFARPLPVPSAGDWLRSARTSLRNRIGGAIPGPRLALALGVVGVIGAAFVGTAAMARRSDGSDGGGGVPASNTRTAASVLPVTGAAGPVGALPVDALPVVTGVAPGAVAVSSAPASVVPSSGQGPTPPTLVVHAAGAVRQPGVYRLPDPSRVDDVVREAGGLAAEADVDAVNLAARVGDGERVFVPRKGQVPPSVVVGSAATAMVGSVPGAGASSAGSASSGAASGSSSTVVDLNAATSEQLDALPGVGPAIAARIVEHRTRIGRFRSINQLLDVPGIGEAKLASMRSRIKV